MEENHKSQEAKTGSRKEQGRMNSAHDGEQLQWQKHSCSAPFSSLFALISLWDLICNDEFNSGSSCLN